MRSTKPAQGKRDEAEKRIGHLYPKVKIPPLSPLYKRGDRSLDAPLLQRGDGGDFFAERPDLTPYIRKHGEITRKDVTELCRVGPFPASRLLKKHVKGGDLKLTGKGRGAYYAIAEKINERKTRINERARF